MLQHRHIFAFLTRSQHGRAHVGHGKDSAKEVLLENWQIFQLVTLRCDQMEPNDGPHHGRMLRNAVPVGGKSLPIFRLRREEDWEGNYIYLK